VLEPSLKGLIGFSRGYSDEHRLQLRLRALECSKEDIQAFAEKYLMSAIESGKTSRVVFGSQSQEVAELTNEDLIIIQSDRYPSELLLGNCSFSSLISSSLSFFSLSMSISNANGKS